MGRYYEEDSFWYFLQVHECVRKARYKIKVKQWIDTPFPARYDRYVCDWHFFIKALGEKMPEFSEKEQSQASMYVLKLFYSKSYGISPEGDFYTDFYDRFYPDSMKREMFSVDEMSNKLIKEKISWKK